MRHAVRIAAIAGMSIWASAVVATPASASVAPLTKAQVTTCSGALLSHKVMTTQTVAACLAAAQKTYTPSLCSSGPKAYVVEFKGRLVGQAATIWAIRAGAKPDSVSATTSDAAVEAAVCGRSALLQAVPASMSSSWVQPPAETPGPEAVGVPSGPPLADQAKMATGATVDGVQCQANEQTVVHVHTHLTIYVRGQARVIPYGIGVPGFRAAQANGGRFVELGNCFYWLHTHATDGIIHVESPNAREQFTLGQFFDEWGEPLSNTQVGPATGKVTAFITAPGSPTVVYKGDPRNLPLGDHFEIQLDVGTPIVAPYTVTNWGSL